MNSQTLPNLPSYAAVTQNTMFPKKDQAIVIDAIENVQIKDYAQALGKIIEPSQIRFLSRISNNRICIYVATKLIADDIINNKKSLTVQNQKLTMRPLINPNKRIILSNVCPIIPHNEIEKKLQEIQIKPMSPISFLRAGLNETGYNHILSFRRQLYVTPEDFSRLPEKISLDFEETTYWIYISSDTMTCFLCKNEGHVASKCPENSSASTELTTVVSGKLHNSEGVSFKRPHPPTESSTTTEISIPIEDHIEDNKTTDESCSDDDIGDFSQSSSDEKYKTKGGKKLRKNPNSDLDSINWQQVENFLANTSKMYPLTGKQVKSYLKDTFGIKNIDEITYSYTDDIVTLIELFKDLLPIIPCRSVKNRLTRIISKLKILKSKSA